MSDTCPKCGYRMVTRSINVESREVKAWCGVCRAVVTSRLYHLPD